MAKRIIPTHYLLMECGQGHKPYEVPLEFRQGKFFTYTGNLYCDDCTGKELDCRLFPISNIRKINQHETSTT